MQSLIYLLLASVATNASSCGVGVCGDDESVNLMNAESRVELTFSPNSSKKPRTMSNSDSPKIVGYSMGTARVMNANVPENQNKYTSAKAETGYGMASQVGVTVDGPGTMARATFKFDISCITADDVLKEARNEYESWDKKYQEQVDKKWFKNEAGLDGIFKILPYSVKAKGGMSRESTDVSESFETTNRADNLLRKIHDTTEQKVTVEGEVYAMGIRDYPVSAYAWVRIMHIDFDNGERKTVLESPQSPNVALTLPADGATGEVATGSKKVNTFPALG